MLVVVLFSLGDINKALNSPTRYPIIEIFTGAAKSAHGGTAMVIQLRSLTQERQS